MRTPATFAVPLGLGSAVGRTSVRHVGLKSDLPATGLTGLAFKQRGVVLFFTLIALLAMSLAAVALIRSVDTSTLIAGNLSFKQAATTSGDAGIEAAMTWLNTTQTGNPSINVLIDPSLEHPFNNTGGTGAFINTGYYSYTDPALILTATLWNDEPSWTDDNSTLVGTDGSGNTTRYIIQRMCRLENTRVQDAQCLFSSASEDSSGQQIPLPQEVCDSTVPGNGCPMAGQSPQLRITSRVTGPKNTVSYIQAFVY
ncbi:MAG: hypothetical protein U1C96_12770 [Gallionella sp.]|nr:hypothetical protein [Gallionella sp.]